MVVGKTIHHLRTASTIISLIAWLSLLAATPAQAQVPLPSAITIWDGTMLSQSVTVSVDAINKIAISGNVTLTINSATAGSQPDSDSDASTTYNVTVNGPNTKLTGALDSAYTTGITLDVLLQAPTGGTPTQKTLGVSAQDLVTGIAHVAESGLTITYTATATTAVASNGAGVARTVTFTLADV
jgi:hypothetical protein